MPDEKNEKKIDTTDRDKRFIYTESDINSILGIQSDEKKITKNNKK